MSESDEKFYETIRINGKDYEYMMTSNTEILKAELEKLDCRLPMYYDYRLNPNLSTDVRKKMAERKTKWSLTTSHKTAVLNYYTEDENGKGTPYIIHLAELIDPKRIRYNYSKKIFETFRVIGNQTLDRRYSEWSALMLAVSQRKSEIVRLFLESGVDANLADKEGFTPLMLAAFLNDTEIMKLLIQYGADVNAQSKSGFSALIYAIYMNSIDAVKLLEQNESNLNISISPKLIEEKRSFLKTFEFYLSNYSLNGLADISLIYKRGGMSKQTFSKIRSNDNDDYHPQKVTVLQLAIGLRLTLPQTESLLSSAGYVFDEKKTADRIIKEHIKNRDFDINKINEEIWKETGKSFLREEK